MSDKNDRVNLPTNPSPENQQLQGKDRTVHCSFKNCGKEFSRPDALRRHQKIHTNQRNIVCPEAGCGKKFSRKDNLKCHMRTHTGERPYPCDRCSKAFIDRRNLDMHKSNIHDEHFPIAPKNNTSSQNKKRKKHPASKNEAMQLGSSLREPSTEHPLTTTIKREPISPISYSFITREGTIPLPVSSQFSIPSSPSIVFNQNIQAPKKKHRVVTTSHSGGYGDISTSLFSNETFNNSLFPDPRFFQLTPMLVSDGKIERTLPVENSASNSSSTTLSFPPGPSDFSPDLSRPILPTLSRSAENKDNKRKSLSSIPVVRSLEQNFRSEKTTDTDWDSGIILHSKLLSKLGYNEKELMLLNKVTSNPGVFSLLEQHQEDLLTYNISPLLIRGILFSENCRQNIQNKIKIAQTKEALVHGFYFNLMEFLVERLRKKFMSSA